ncbi:MAG: amino acid ABC transporter permease [Gammaproteobacteria bacterium]|nr:amino acid ABC transporter permease [Gammaproteobacteria bacterium]
MTPTHDKRGLPPKRTLWNDATIRALAFQLLTVFAVTGLLLYIVLNTLHNMDARGISTGFDFLSRPAGFGITQSFVEYSESTSTYGRTFIVGLLNTLVVSVLGIVLASLLGLIIGVARLSKNWLIAKLAAIYIELFRNIPLLLQILFWYFAVFLTLPEIDTPIQFGDSTFLTRRGLYLPSPVFANGFSVVLGAAALAIAGAVAVSRWASRRRERTGRQFPSLLVATALVIGIPMLAFFAAGRPLSWDAPKMGTFDFDGGMVVIPELGALLLALSIYTATFIAETVRAGILAVSHGQTEAAYALGLRPSWTLRLVVIPQALRVAVPPLTSQYLNLIKNSTLAAAIGYPDLFAVFTGTVLNQTGQAVEVIAMTMAVYLTISLLISLFMNWYNANIALVER